MKPDKIQNLLADYLGDELDPARKAEFERALDNDPDLAAEVDSLRKTIRAMRSLDVPSVVPPALSPAHPPGAAPRMLGIMRYAASILIAFTLGALVRDVAMAPDSAPPSRVITIDEPGPGAVERKLAAAYNHNAAKSGLARSLLAVAHATR